MKLGLGRKNQSSSGNIRSLLREVDLPTLPTVVTSALGQLGDRDANLGDVGATVTQDAGLSLQLLKVTNSATFAPRTPVDTVHQAVVMLGKNELESMLLSLGVAKALPRPSAPEFDSTEFWSTAGFRAGVAAGVAEVVSPARRSFNFTAALLQDMALPLLAASVDGYAEIVANREPSQRLHQVEAVRFGWDHTEVGSWMAEEWRFPPHLTDGIVDHHLRQDRELDILRAVAEIRGTDENLAMDTVPEAIEQWCGLPRDQAATIVQDGLVHASSISTLIR